MLKFRKPEMLKFISIIKLVVIIQLAPILSNAQTIGTNDPITVAQKIGDKLIADTPFKYCLDISYDAKQFTGLQLIDFGRNFKTNSHGAAYAYSQFYSSDETELEIQIGHSDACMFWVNGKLVYENLGEKKLELIYEERSIELPFHFNVNLKKGINSILIKSTSNKKNWRVYLQPPSAKGAVESDRKIYPEIGLKKLDLVNVEIAKLSNWLILGPFNEDIEINNLLTDEKPVIGQMFDGLLGPTTWTIPKIEVVGNFIDPLPWGTNYNWNYHNGGVAWAMKMLGEISKMPKYEKYSYDFCNFHLNSIPFLSYEIEELGKRNVPNALLLKTPLLDFTLAPSLPLIYRLRKDSEFPNRNKYIQFIDEMLDYARNRQIRLPGATNFTRTTPQKYTTWVDDMFMGIPFLMQAAMYADNEEDRNLFFDDAATQVLDFNKVVWDDEANLYVHAKYSNSDEKMVHWSRANGWGIWATTEVLKYLPRNHKKYKSILKHYRTHVESLLAYQHDTGFWHNVLDYPKSREEVSGTAIFTMAIARGVSEGWLKGKKYELAAEKGWDAICSKIEEDGTVNNICYGTMCSSDVNYYLNRPFYKNDTHGLFAVLFAAIEMSKMQ